MGKARSRADGDYKTDNAVVDFGADGDVTLTHDPDDGLILKSKATADDNPVLLTLQTGETDLAANDVIGKIAFQAPDEGTGTDAILVSAAIQARAEGDHSSSSNATSIDFMVGASEVAATKMTLTSAGKLEVAGGVDIEGGAVFNEDSADVDFRVESDNDANAFFVQGSDGKIGMGISTPRNNLDFGVTSNNDHVIALRDNNTSRTILGLSNGYGVRVGSPSDGTSSENMFEVGEINASDGTTYQNTHFAVTYGGDVTISTGDIIFGTSGKGINLGVTSNTDSNTLADYEEGTWTFAVTLEGSGTATVSGSYNTGSYVKVGQVVHCGGDLRLSGVSSPNGEVRISLPFTGINNTKRLFVGNILTVGIDKQSGQDYGGFFVRTAANEAKASVFWQSTSSHFGLQGQNGGLGANDTFLFSVTYLVEE